jgi:RNase H-like domain found in reverse transcriptase
MSQKENGETRPICYTSRVLSEVGKKNSNTEREPLAIFCAITTKIQFDDKDKKVKVCSENKPLVGSCKLT